ncbi:Similar to fem1c: Protein fem-1 homolog C (Danio rerio) [Cotesia congregata]|uniref:Similar to fem1c: Protein fem-1 homolog C (Danio rerio) n=1 Tax=Cotesia congregata TaxID=51543 RepID=A0A8J2MZL7_COTCN|nr:Similar to fem1c: Protein fem-1 homolog C (Danio rerio) [Cotesia congregata]
MRMQALVIRERILGPAHPDTSYYIRYRGAVYADSGKFERCIELWNYALDMQQSMLEPLNTMTQSSLFSFIELFSFMVAGADPTCKDNDGNTALHLTAISYPWRTDLATILLCGGAHLDTVNNDGHTYESLLDDKIRFMTLNPIKYTTLMCLAARAIRKNNNYIDINRVPVHLRDFVLQH